MVAPDARTRSQITLSQSQVLSGSRIPLDVLRTTLLTNALFVSALQLVKGWVSVADVDVFWATLSVLGVGALAAFAREVYLRKLGNRKNVEWSAVGFASIMLFLQVGSLFIMLHRMSAVRVILFTHFSATWMMKSCLESLSMSRLIAICTAFMLSFMSSAYYSEDTIQTTFLIHCALLIYGATSNALEHTRGILSVTLGAHSTLAYTSLGAFLLALPLYTFRKFALNWPPSSHSHTYSIVVIPFAAYTLLYHIPRNIPFLTNPAKGVRSFIWSYPLTLLAACVTGFTIFDQNVSWTDLAVGASLYYGLYFEDANQSGIHARTPTSRLIQSYMKTILSNPESRKIFYFLMLNMCYMLVQMLYGIWTNSLGLISDAIHMAFDCMAIGVGLLASIMATWPPNERFTYGFGRIETLSGFANGIFLILISIFIVFEAIERLIEPPEMNTRQLLLVSSLGLAVNLFGMFAMGGHHHHGHSHGHSHSHSHNDHDHLDHTHDHAACAQDHSHHDHDHPQHDHDRPHHDHEGLQPADEHVHDGYGASHSHHNDKHPHRDQVRADSHGHNSHSLLRGSHSDSEARPSHGPPHHDHQHVLESGRQKQSLNGNHGHAHADSILSPTSSVSSSFVPRYSADHDTAMHYEARGIEAFKKAFTVEPVRLSDGYLDDDVDGSHRVQPTARLSTSPSNTSPTTPKYKFGHDDHFKTHHTSRIPNLHDHSHTHDHSHSGHSHNMRGVFLHVMADTLGSVGVIISTLLIQLYGWTGFDPIASLFIAVLIAASVVPLVIDTGKILALDIGDRQTNIQRTLSELSAIEGLASYTSPRFWPKDSSSLIGSIHIQLKPSRSSFDPTGPHSTKRVTHDNIDRVVERVDALLRSGISGLQELTIQVEPMSLT